MANKAQLSFDPNEDLTIYVVQLVFDGRLFNLGTIFKGPVGSEFQQRKTYRLNADEMIQIADFMKTIEGR